MGFGNEHHRQFFKHYLYGSSNTTTTGSYDTVNVHANSNANTLTEGYNVTNTVNGNHNHINAGDLARVTFNGGTAMMVGTAQVSLCPSYGSDCGDTPTCHDAGVSWPELCCELPKKRCSNATPMRLAQFAKSSARLKLAKPEFRSRP